MPAVLGVGTLKGIVVAIIVSLIGLASQTAYPRVSVIGRKRGADVLRPLSPDHPEDETFEGLLIVRPEGRLFFVNVQYVAEQINTGRAVQATRGGVGHEPGSRYRILGTANVDGGGEASNGTRIRNLAGGAESRVLEVIRCAGLGQATRS